MGEETATMHRPSLFTVLCVKTDLMLLFSVR